MSNIAHVRFAADQLAWFIYNYKADKDQITTLIHNIVLHHNLDISKGYFDMVESLANTYYQDIVSNRSVVCE